MTLAALVAIVWIIAAAALARGWSRERKIPFADISRAGDLDLLALCEDQVRYSGGGSRRGGDLTERDQALPAFIPEHRDARSRGSLQRGYAPNLFQLRVVAKHLRQADSGDPACQVMDVVDPDVGREPPEHGREIIVGAAVQRCLVHVPLLIVIPRRLFELVLDVEKPDADRRRQDRDWKVKEQERSDSRSQIAPATSPAMATLVAMVLIQGVHPLRKSPTGSRYCIRKT
mgnify:CR=1 FL=1